MKEAFARVSLALVLAVSSVSKLRAPRILRQYLAGTGLPEAAIIPLGKILPWSELVLALLFLVPNKRAKAVSPVLGEFTLLSFTMFIWYRLMQGDNRPCPCFGQNATAVSGRFAIIRNLFLLYVNGFAGRSMRVEHRSLELISRTAWAGSYTFMLLFGHNRWNRPDETQPSVFEPKPEMMLGEITIEINASEHLQPIATANHRQVMLIFVNSTCQPCMDTLSKLNSLVTENSSLKRPIGILPEDKYTDNWREHYDMFPKLWPFFSVTVAPRPWADRPLATPCAVIVDQVVGKVLEVGLGSNEVISMLRANFQES